MDGEVVLDSLRTSGTTFLKTLSGMGQWVKGLNTLSPSFHIPRKFLNKMYRSRHFVFIGCIFLFTFPGTLQKDFFVLVNEGLVITLNQTSPSLSALNDVYDFKGEQSTPKTHKRLQVSEYFGTTQKSWTPTELNNQVNPVPPKTSVETKFKVKVAAIEPKFKKPMEKQRPPYNFYFPESLQEKANQLIQEALSQNTLKTDVQRNFVQVERKDSLRGFAQVASLQATEPHKDYLIKGDLEMAGGLAFLNTQKINVYHSHQGSRLNVGQVWPHEGRFQISVSDFKGDLGAELVDGTGRIVGRGNLDLGSLDSLNSRQSGVSGVQLKIRPYQSGLRVSVRDSRQRQGLGAASLEDMGRLIAQRTREEKDLAYVDTSFASSSEVLFTAQQNKHWPTMSLVTSDQDEEVQLYSVPYLQALYDLVGAKNINNSGVILGKVLIGGHPAESVRVEIDHANFLPVYYEDTVKGVDWPSKTRTTTSKNGIFAFVGLEPGLHWVRAKVKGVQLPAQVVPVMEQRVSQIEVGYNGHRHLNIDVKDIATGEPLHKGHLKFVGNEKEIEFSHHEVDLEIKNLPHAVRFEVDLGESYELSRVVVNKTQDHLNTYGVNTNWFEDRLEVADIRFKKQTGVIIGKFDDENRGESYKVHLSQVVENREGKVVYFDSRGEVSEVGVQGGWFLAYDLDLGWQSLMILRSSDNMTLTKVFDVAPEVVNTLSVKYTE